VDLWISGSLDLSISLWIKNKNKVQQRARRGTTDRSGASARVLVFGTGVFVVDEYSSRGREPRVSEPGACSLTTRWETK